MVSVECSKRQGWWDARPGGLVKCSVLPCCFDPCPPCTFVTIPLACSKFLSSDWYTGQRYWLFLPSLKLTHYPRPFWFLHVRPSGISRIIFLIVYSYNWVWNGIIFLLSTLLVLVHFSFFQVHKNLWQVRTVVHLPLNNVVICLQSLELAF